MDAKDASVSALDVHGPTEALRGEVALRIKRAMDRKEWNQSDLARAAGIGRDSVSVYCRAKSLPGSKHLAAMAQALGCEPSDLYPASMEASQPASLQVTQVVGQPGKAWLKMNRAVTMSQMARIMQILAEEPET